MKCAAYTVPRWQYDRVVPSIKSLLRNSDVDKVYMLIEDDTFPTELPKEVECINVSNQRYFKLTGINCVYPWAYMSMMRVALCKVLPDVDVVLALDADSIVDGDISFIWNYPIDDYYFAAVAEPDRCTDKKVYANTGVAIFNLEKMRDGKADGIIRALNMRRYLILEQDCLNELCQGHMALMPSIYNACEYTAPAEKPAIVRHVGVRDWQNIPLVQKYMDIPWKEIRKPVRRRTRKNEALNDSVLSRNESLFDE